jgi:hypothetical protein
VYVDGVRRRQGLAIQSRMSPGRVTWGRSWSAGSLRYILEGQGMQQRSGFSPEFCVHNGTSKVPVYPLALSKFPRT